MKLGSLRLVYMGSSDVEADARLHVQTLGGNLRFFLDRFGARVASVRHGAGADIVFASHMAGKSPILFFEVDDIEALRDAPGAMLIETPIGPGVLFEASGGARLGGLRIEREDYMENAWRTPGHEGAVRPEWL
ncbi:hypothetical protein [Roseobacter weihaiensis]|uniref:hypothetical protein n=1 Tax=Roseobacter weihaiensis TaxID=2763262 RepID=UPI001D0AE342|nr:hypothetical protein [Roseobacter sp. H9]